MIHRFLKTYLVYEELYGYSQISLQRMQWKPAITFILWGLALMMLQFQYLIDYAFLIPAAGILLTFLGFYRLRGENQAWHNCYRLSLLAVVCYPLYLLSIATPLILFHWLIIGFQALFLIYQLLTLFYFHSGFKQIFKRMDTKPSGAPILVLILWVILQQAIAYTRYASSMLVWLSFNIVFLICLWVIWINITNLYNDGYIVKTKIGVLHNGWCMGAYALIIALFLISGTLFTLQLYF